MTSRTLIPALFALACFVAGPATAERSSPKKPPISSQRTGNKGRVNPNSPADVEGGVRSGKAKQAAEKRGAPSTADAIGGVKTEAPDVKPGNRHDEVSQERRQTSRRFSNSGDPADKGAIRDILSMEKVITEKVDPKLAIAVITDAKKMLNELKDDKPAQNGYFFMLDAWVSSLGMGKTPNEATTRAFEAILYERLGKKDLEAVKTIKAAMCNCTPQGLSPQGLSCRRTTALLNAIRGLAPAVCAAVITGFLTADTKGADTVTIITGLNDPATFPVSGLLNTPIPTPEND